MIWGSWHPINGLVGIRLVGDRDSAFCALPWGPPEMVQVWG